jgi:hypothetical protein
MHSVERGQNICKLNLVVHTVTAKLLNGLKRRELCDNINWSSYFCCSVVALHRTSCEDQVASNEFAFGITITPFTDM